MGAPAAARHPQIVSHGGSTGYEATREAAMAAFAKSWRRSSEP
jgi:hypothetical protein